ncbi:MAG: hypothetical protein ACI4UU_03885 [Clostridia bacterium]
MAAKTVKMCDMHISVAAKVFEMLNPGKVKVTESEFFGKVIVTAIEPKELTYPEGWYYAKGNYRNKHQSTTGQYDEMMVVKPNGNVWSNEANYCTLNCD